MLDELLAGWAAEAEVLERCGHVRDAAQLRRRIGEVEAATRAYEREKLTVAEAADETGYTEEHLRALVREGRLPDTRPEGSQGRIRLRRCDLPRKPSAQRDAGDSPAERLARKRLNG